LSSANSALEKRIRRHVTGRDHEFFAITAPGLEALCREELGHLGIQVSDTDMTSGGVTFRGRVHDCYRANLHVRTATRILMRIGAFHAAAFSELEKRCAGVPWDLYLPPGRLPDIHVNTQKSRLYHKGAIAERIGRSIEKRLAGQSGTAAGSNTEPRLAPVIFVRSVRDRMTVSIDSSGDLLHKRGLRSHIGRAPLRETLAAAALLATGYGPGGILADPMCGSGTFTLEAAMISAGIPAGWHRDFAFQAWPCFRPQRWKDIRRSAEAKIAVPDNAHIFAGDTDGDMIPALEAGIDRLQMAGAVDVRVRDFFSTGGRDLSKSPGTLVLNPPYNRRMGTDGKRRRFYRRIFDHLKTGFPGWRVGLYCPKPSAVHFAPALTPVQSVPHGGLTLALLTGTLPA
jgi:putative N6-adenine-specific DNA methylase